MRMTQSLYRALVGRYLQRFEQRYDYDMSYAQTILSASSKGFGIFSGLFKMASHRDQVPLGPWFAAKWVATDSEDCGACLQLLINMGREEGLPLDLMRAISAGDCTAMPDDVALTYRWAKSTLHHAARDEDEQLREAILARWGKRGLISLTLAMAGARSFPFVKRALGHQQSCQMLQWEK